MSSRGDIRKVIRKARRRGWVILGVAANSASHHVLEWKDGTRITASASPSDNRSTRNFMADMKRVERNCP